MKGGNALSSARLAASGSEPFVHRNIWLLLFILNAALSGCAGDVTRVDEKRLVAAESIAPNEAITVIGLSGVIDDTLDCIDDEVRSILPGAQVMRPIEFRDRLFPWFEPNLAPRDTDSLSKLMRQPMVKRRVAELGVRYVVIILSGTTATTPSSWGIAFGGCCPPAALVIGGVGTEEKTVLNASILDMKKIQSVGQIEAAAEGSAQVGLIVLIPYAYSVSSLKGACKSIAERVGAYVTGKPQPVPAAEPPSQ